MSFNKRNILGTALILLSASVVILLYKNYKDNKKSYLIQDSLKQETELSQSQLSEMLKKYDSVMVQYNNLENSVNDVASLSKNPSTSNNFELENPTSIRLVTNQIQKIQDSIKILSGRLKNLENLKANFNSNTKKPQRNTANSITISTSNNIELTNLQARGVKFLNENNNGKKKDIEQIRVCFTLDKSLGIQKGDKELFIQIVNPKNSIVTSDNNQFQTETNILQYSKKVAFYYNQEATDVCNYVDIPKNRIAKGRYLINIYSGSTKIGSTIFNYY
jgi:hypothetical protein